MNPIICPNQAMSFISQFFLETGWPIQKKNTVIPDDKRGSRNSGKGIYFFPAAYPATDNGIKCFRVLYHTLNSIECAGNKVEYHEYIISNDKWCHDTMSTC